MVKSTRLEQLLDAPDAAFGNWRDIIQEINKEFPNAETEEKRIALLAVFKATMDIAESQIAPEDVELFKEERSKHYKSFIYQECLVGQNICAETLYAVTGREVAAGRMASDDAMRKTAEIAMAVPHFTRAEMLAQSSHPPPDPSQEQAKAERQSRALHDLDPASYFGLNRREVFFYRLLCLMYHRREKMFSRPIERELASMSGPLSDFKRGLLLGKIDGLYMARSISLNMYYMLQCEIQNRKD
ncbi:MAG: hypothetical protein ACXWTH_05390 [Methylosarcina sp.]